MFFYPFANEIPNLELVLREAGAKEWNKCRGSNLPVEYNRERIISGMWLLELLIKRLLSCVVGKVCSGGASAAYYSSHQHRCLHQPGTLLLSKRIGGKNTDIDNRKSEVE